MFSEITKAEDQPSDYTLVCMLRSTYIKVRHRKMEGDVSGGLDLLRSAVSLMHELESRLLSQPQMLFWAEQVLAQMALMASDGLDVSSPASDKQIDTALQAFRHWAIFSARSRDTILDDFGIAQPVVRKIQVWKAYYLFLSKLVEHGVDYHALGEKHTRLHQVAELRRIESTYESELLRITKFPRAHESNQMIEEWVEQVMRNWEVLCGRSWPEVDLGEGGRNAVGRNALDILYRAATKTFHSTLILRRLFQVHTSLADFDLAYKALDSYLELVIRGKARALKSHETPPNIDDAGTILRTVSEAVEGLCLFGRKEEAEKASKLTTRLQEWTQDYSLRTDNGQNGEQTGPESGQIENPSSSINLQTLETAYRAIGIGTAFWAMWNPVSEQRSTSQSQALASLNQASHALSNSPPSLNTAYAQALLLAETRDVKNAIDCVKRALSSSAALVADHDYAQQRRVMAFWHLLALLLSARQDFSTAYQMCGAAFDQFGDFDILSNDRAASVNGNVDSSEEKALASDDVRGLIDDMDGRERERIIEIKMTQLCLIDVVEGADEALNGSNELLGLFSRLFGHLGVGKDEKAKPKIVVPPKSSAGTIKSLRGSIFGRKRHEQSTSRQTDETNGSTSVPDQSLVRYSTHTTEAPTIHITDEDTPVEKHRRHPFRRSHSHTHDDSHSHKLHKREASGTSIIRRQSRSTKRKPATSVVSSQRQSFETGPEQLSTRASIIADRANGMNRHRLAGQFGSGSHEGNLTANSSAIQSHNQIPEAKTSLPRIAHNIHHREAPPPAGHQQQPPQQDVRLPVMHPSTTSTQPSPRFPRSVEQIHAHGVLVKVWLLVAGLYRRASLFEDSKEACDEASKSAAKIEDLVAAQQSSASAFADPGWGGGKSSNEVWADVHSERAYLALTKGMPHEAIKEFEEALTYSLDHPRATVGLSNILLDIFEQKIPSEPPRPGLDISIVEKLGLPLDNPTGHPNAPSIQDGQAACRAGDELRKTPENLNRLAARDRAYGLLSNLTRLGTSWDDSEAWYALARAHECSGQIEKAKEVLWWCVELEDRRPVRHWRNIGTGSYVL